MRQRSFATAFPGLLALLAWVSACAGGPLRKTASATPDSAGSNLAEVDESPGLGTSWGETRRSQTQVVPFTRCSADPAMAVALYYDDADGVEAMADRSSWGGAEVQPAADVNVAVVDDAGAPLPGVSAGGRNWIVGYEGARYEIQVQNSGAQRYEVVASVDGLDVVDGRPASLDKRGYIVAPGSTLVIDGFRTSLEEVAAFRFGRVDASYAARTGQPANIGVIGVAIFCEASGALEQTGSYEPDPFPAR